MGIIFHLRGSGIRRYVLVGWMLAAIYGLTDEIHQSFVPVREALMYDMVADGIWLLCWRFWGKEVIMPTSQLAGLIAKAECIL